MRAALLVLQLVTQGLQVVACRHQSGKDTLDGLASRSRSGPGDGRSQTRRAMRKDGPVEFTERLPHPFYDTIAEGLALGHRDMAELQAGLLSKARLLGGG